MGNNSARIIRAEFPGAEAVHVLGPFNNWSTTRSPMRPVGDGRWELRLPGDVDAGEIRYLVYDQRDRFGRLVADRSSERVACA
jgi:1,4-alpha-glucan branching enzyme